MMAKLRAVILLTGFVGVALLAMPFQIALLRVNRTGAKRLPHIYHRYLCWLIGIRVIVRGTPYQEGACLITANHTSWLDIPILASLAPSSFVAKREVAAWPFFGMLAKLQQTVFVDRERRTRTAQSRNEIHARIAAGDTLVLFPEGTSSDGNRVLPFKSALMSVAQLALVTDEEDRENDLVVQPLSIAYVRLHGVPMGRYYRPFFAWYGDMDLFPHLWQAFTMGPIDVIAEYHPPVTIRHVGNRKALAAYCQTHCAAGVARALLGRDIPVPGVQGLAAAPGAGPVAGEPAAKTLENAPSRHAAGRAG